MKLTAPVRTHYGFTIIELMIATVIFAFILLIATAGILQFSKQYYKGIVSSTTQGAARTLVDDISRSLQFNNGAFTPLSGINGSQGFCVGGVKRYSYVLNRQLTDDAPVSGMHQSRHVLVSDNLTSNCSSSLTALDVEGLQPDLTAVSPALSNPREMLGQRMRLTKFDITPSTNDVYTITVRIVYGEDDLLCSPSAGDCGDPDSTAGVDGAKPDLTCRPSAGSQYCATSELSTTIRKRAAL